MKIQPKLNRFDLSMIVISLVIGMGIFGTPSDVAAKAGNVWIFFGAWIFGGVVTLCGALTFAEIGARYPHTGGFYKIFSYCYHPAFAFMVNWVQVICNAAAVSAVSLLGAEYIAPIILPAGMQNGLGVKLVTISTVLILYVINFIGIKQSARAQNLLTLFKVAMIVLLFTAVFTGPDAQAHQIQAIPYQGNPVVAFGLSMVAVFFTYTGYAQVINFGGDVINPKKNIPGAIFRGIATVIFLYLAINIAYYKVLGFGGLQSTHTLAAKMAGVLLGPVGAKVTSVLMFLSVVAYMNVYILSMPRMYYAMAEDGVLPPIFKKVNPRTQVQEFGMSFFVGVVLLILFFVGSFSQLLNYVVFFELIGTSIAALAIFMLRKKTAGASVDDIYTIKWYPFVPAFFIAAYWFVTVSIFISFRENPYAILLCLAAYAFGLAIYFLINKRNLFKKI